MADERKPEEERVERPKDPGVPTGRVWDPNQVGLTVTGIGPLKDPDGAIRNPASGGWGDGHTGD